MKSYAVPFEKYVNLADARLGTKAISVTDDWFADVNRLFQPTPAVWKEGVFDDNGKWMDGWESRRKRFEGYDHAVIRLGVPGSINNLETHTRNLMLQGGSQIGASSLRPLIVEQRDSTQHEDATHCFGEPTRPDIRTPERSSSPPVRHAQQQRVLMPSP